MGMQVQKPYFYIAFSDELPDERIRVVNMGNHMYVMGSDVCVSWQRSRDTDLLARYIQYRIRNPSHQKMVIGGNIGCKSVPLEGNDTQQLATIEMFLGILYNITAVEPFKAVKGGHPPAP